MKGETGTLGSKAVRGRVREAMEHVSLFQVDFDLPDRFSRLLEQLDRATLRDREEDLPAR
ncbi:hypothetical protein NGM99_11380 [Mesorhizobium sp. RP14(2022)]|uniref:Anti-sigma factor NepR domain-containing protein n=1 Tax=Mesorhizobium liriopis TaxID=2953882 RepID=A0ABT1C6D3_9HYPH|nr:hypothetical protein [Mesorhizobium liriopis]MCO6050385.1 hypothetical protein [Mesorhizobium liriopis]